MHGIRPNRSSYHKPNRSICDPHTESLEPNVLVGSLDRLLCLGLRSVDRDCDDGFAQVFGSLLARDLT